jgi:hypothetical protein
MSFKEAIENHIALFFLGTLTVGFASGWGAYRAIQIATGQTSISIDRLKELERPVTVDKNALQTKVEELELERNDLLKRLARNRPTTGNYVHNVVITPTSPAVLGIGSAITVRFDYVLAKDEQASIWAWADGPTQYYGAAPVSGTGTEEAQITGQRAGKVREVTIRMGSTDGETLYEMKLPVDFTFK